MQSCMATCRQTHIGGEEVFVDFAGDTIDIFDPITGEVRAMKMFVAAMRASISLRRGLPKREPVRLDRRACQSVPVSGRRSEVHGLR
jgi:transposase